MTMEDDRRQGIRHVGGKDAPRPPPSPVAQAEPPPPPPPRVHHQFDDQRYTWPADRMHPSAEPSAASGHHLHIAVFDEHHSASSDVRELYACRTCGAEAWVEAPARARPTTYAWLQAVHWLETGTEPPTGGATIAYITHESRDRDALAAEFYEDPANREPTGPAVPGPTSARRDGKGAPPAELWTEEERSQRIEDLGGAYFERVTEERPLTEEDQARIAKLLAERRAPARRLEVLARELDEGLRGSPLAGPTPDDVANLNLDRIGMGAIPVHLISSYLRALAGELDG